MLRSQSRSKKRGVDNEPTEEVPMDAQSPEATDACTSQAANIRPHVPEIPEENPPTTEGPNPAQKLSKHAQTLQSEMKAALCQMQSVCQENEEKSEAVEKLTKEVSSAKEINASLKEQLQNAEVEKRGMAEELKHRDAEIYSMKIDSESLRRKCFELTEEKRKCAKEMDHLSAECHASQLEIGNLTKRVKDTELVENRLSVVLARKQALEIELKDKDEKLTDAVRAYKLQLDISGGYYSKLMTLQDQNAQLGANLEHVTAQFAAVSSELERMKCDFGELKTHEQGLQLLLRESDRTISELRQKCDAQNQHLINIATFATTVVNPEEQGVQARYNLRSRNKTATSEASGVIAMDGLDAYDGMLCPAPQSRSLPTGTNSLQLPISNLPEVSTTILSHHVRRIAPKWLEIGHALGVGDFATALQQTEKGQDQKCLLCLEEWINNGSQGVGCSWEILLNELCHFQLHAVAREIQVKIEDMAISNHSM